MRRKELEVYGVFVHMDVYVDICMYVYIFCVLISNAVLPSRVLNPGRYDCTVNQS